MLIEMIDMLIEMIDMLIEMIEMIDMLIEMIDMLIEMIDMLIEMIDMLIEMIEMIDMLIEMIEMIDMLIEMIDMIDMIDGSISYAEENVLAYDWIVLHQVQLCGDVARILHGRVGKAGASKADEAYQDSSRLLGHGARARGGGKANEPAWSRVPLSVCCCILDVSSITVERTSERIT